MSVAARLHEAIETVCPVKTVRVSGGALSFVPADGATPEQVAAGNAIVESFDASEEATDAWRLDKTPERKAVLEAAAQAVADIDAYLAIANPTAAQVRTAVTGLAQIMRKLIRYIVTLD